ncbi:MAG: hypothetical protein J6K95_02005 [Rikenellaceae bacterium]|nr:hypothetical protein [Rikenellaceae bacterium]
MFFEYMSGAAEQGYAATTVVRSMGWGALVLGATVAGALYLFGCKRIRHWLVARLKFIAAGLWMAGLIVYLIGFCGEEGGWSLGISTGLRAALSSMEMFVSHSDLIEVHAHWHHEPVYMFFFAVIHFLAVAVSAVFVIHLLGSRLLSWLKMWRDGRFGRKSRLYVFFGTNEASMLLAQNIAREHGKEALRDGRGRESYRIVFVSMPSDEMHSPRFSFSHFFSARSHGNDSLERIESLDAVVAYADRELTPAAADGRVFEAAGLGNLERMVERADAVSLFLLSDDEPANVRHAEILNSSLAGRCPQGKSAGTEEPGRNKYTLYCHARREGVHNLLENLERCDRVEIRVLDPSFLSVEQLKMNVEYQPVSFVEVGADASVRSGFEALIVGFGETGEDALRFLYEFGAFADSRGERSPFRCTVMDKDMERLRARFCMRTPALGRNPAVRLLDTDYRTEEFWSWMREAAATLNYVVIALGDDEAGMTLAADLCDFVTRYAGRRENFRIFVRSYRPEKAAYMERIAAFYDTKEIGAPIVVFGRMTDIYGYDLIVGDRVREEAVRFYERYNLVTTGEKGKPWGERRKEALRRNTLAALRGLCRKEGQDMANALHRKTKIRMLERVLRNENSPLCGTKLSDWQRSLRARTGAGAGIAYPELAPGCDIGPVMLRMAQSEHLRWMAAHELMGYLPTAGQTDELRKVHACLVPWDELDEVSSRMGYDTKACDFAVVETAVELNNDKR